MIKFLLGAFAIALLVGSDIITAQDIRYAGEYISDRAEKIVDF